MAELATRQYGVVATRQLAELGFGRNSVAKAAKEGRLHRVHRGVYVVGYRRLSWHGRCMAAVLAASPSVASHLSAAWLWGIVRNRPGTIHLTCPSARRSRRSFVVHEGDLSDADRTVRDGIPVTSLPRTILDLSAGRSVQEIRRQIQRAEDAKVFDLRQMRDLLGRSNGHHGETKVRIALETYEERPVFTRSDLERRFLDLVIAAGLPTPAMNHFVEGYEIDAYWEDERFGVELDVYETHGSRLSFEEDRERDDALLGAGIETTRVTGLRLDREPGLVIASIGRHLARRSRAPLE
jgi:predicted transcriptional regulator of viral defense system